MSEPAIVAEGLRKCFGKVVAVEDATFTVGAGSSTALLGGNGAGKTTTIAMLLGLVLPPSGTARVLGHDMSDDRQRALPALNFSSPYIDLPHRLTVRQNLEIYARLYGLDAVAERCTELAAQLDVTGFL